jgi:hypothetical protein
VVVGEVAPYMGVPRTGDVVTEGAVVLRLSSEAIARIEAEQPDARRSAPPLACLDPGRLAGRHLHTFDAMLD